MCFIEEEKEKDPFEMGTMTHVSLKRLYKDVRPIVSPMNNGDRSKLAVLPGILKKY